MRKYVIMILTLSLALGSAYAQDAKDKQSPKTGAATVKNDPKPGGSKDGAPKDAASKDAGAKDGAAKEVAAKTDPKVKTDFVKRGPFGLGIYIGQPMSLSAKVFINRWNAIDMGLGYWLGAPDEQGLAINTDYLFHWRDALTFYGDELPIVAGLGLIMTIPQQQVPIAPTAIRLRAPLGLAIPLRDLAMELGAEVVPMYHVYGFDDPLNPPSPEERFAVSAAGFVRFYF